MTNPVFEAFLDGFTGGGLFTPLRQPGAATQVFAHDDSPEAKQEDPGLVRDSQEDLAQP